ncbi:MAG: zinc ribbon domain-containing protein [Gammaproteobacteria bacterium]|nr:zinc ribbon domain-containing protein [Gammaproteobacteria bacterium]
MINCRECQKQVSEQAFACPHCGAPYPAKAQWDGWGYEYKSQAEIFGWPLVHISFKFSPQRRPKPANGFIAIGQFGAGVICISQFGVGLFTLAQFGLGYFAITQIGAAYQILAQVGLYWDKGYGQLVYSMKELLGI